jgi:hypothetical protein
MFCLGDLFRSVKQYGVKSTIMTATLRNCELVFHKSDVIEYTSIPDDDDDYYYYYYY